MKRIIAASFAIMLAIAIPLNAQITVDGQLDSTGYTLAATQTNNTGFGDNASEWNAMYTAVEGTRIFVLVTGNLENNFNKLEVFFDSVAGGENSLSSIPEYDFPDDNPPAWQSQRLGGMISGTPGLTFDSGFEADYHLFARHGFDPKAEDFDFNVLDVDFIDRLGGTSQLINGNTMRTAFDFDTQIGVGMLNSADLANNAAAGAIVNAIEIGFDNNNMAGVSGDTTVAADPVAAEAVTTGFEFSIDVSDLGIDPANAATIKICVMQNGGRHDFMSNQILPGVDAPTGIEFGNLGGDNMGNFTGDVGGVDMTAWTGDQFFCIDYTPSAGCPFMPGDIDENGAVNLLDVGPFIDLLGGGDFVCQGDLNNDGTINLLDVVPFIDILNGG